MSENKNDENKEKSGEGRLSGLGQKIIGEIETLAGVINADPLAQAEGEFNVEVGTIREDIEESIDDDEDQ